jgi:hypothetical protein
MKREMNDSGRGRSTKGLARLNTVNTRTISTTFLFFVCHLVYLLLSSTKMVVVEAEAFGVLQNEKIQTHNTPNNGINT